MTIQISKYEYKKLLRQSAKLELLENAGIDNWTWYGDALNPDGKESYSDICDRIDAE